MKKRIRKILFAGGCLLSAGALVAGSVASAQEDADVAPIASVAPVAPESHEDAAAHESPVEGVTPVRPVFSKVRDAQGMYARAATMLRDRSIKNVSSVPAMLENCVQDGYIPAAYLLLDVYEGKYVGLVAQPQKAYKLAYSLAKVKPPKDETKEARALRHEAMFRCASYSERGLGCKQSATDAYRRMYRAAAEGMGKARVELARYLMNGKGCKPNPRLALRLLMEQAVQAPSTPHLFFYLGYMHFYGLGLPKRDRAQALRYFERGASMGDTRAMNNLAAMYERGIVVSKDTDMALRFYKRAAAGGNKEASANMQRLGYRAGEKEDHTTTMGERVCNASLHIVRALPMTRHLKDLLTEFFRRGSSTPQP